MTVRRGRLTPKTLLELMHEVEELTTRLRASTERPADLRRAAVRRTRTLRRLKGALSRGGDPFRAALHGLAGASGLKPDDLVILVALFQRRLRRPEPASQGRDLLEVVASRNDVATRARALHPDAPLIRAGFVMTDAFHPEQVFDAGFRLNDDVFKLLYRAYHGLLFDPSPERVRPAPFTSWSEHLIAYRALSELAKRRATKLFPQSGWAEATTDEERSADELTVQLDMQSALIRAREDVTPEHVRLPIVELRHQFELSAEEELIVVTLLAQELYTARAAVELGDLLRLVARGEDDLLQRRSLMAAEGRLRDTGLLVVEGEAEGKDLLATGWIAPWAAERLLGAADSARAINADERSKFHAYLEKLQGSEDFYRRL